ncbi:MAG: GvpL/GvpF family gas vesicle protein [Pseudomonadota bacterium]
MLILHAIGFRSDLQDLELDEANLLDITCVSAGELAAIVSSVRPGGENLFEDADSVRALALAHHHLLQAVSHHCDALPIQLGALHSDPETVRKALETHAQDWARQLEGVAGCCEVSIQVTAKQQQTGENAQAIRGGRDYLKARRAQRDQRRSNVTNGEAGMAHLQDALTPMARRFAAGSTDLRFLVERQQLDNFLAAAAAAQTSDAMAGLAVQATGPWPVYSFMEAA